MSMVGTPAGMQREMGLSLPKFYCVRDRARRPTAATECLISGSRRCRTRVLRCRWPTIRRGPACHSAFAESSRLRSGLPSIVRGMPGVRTLDHCPNMPAAARKKSPIAVSNLVSRRESLPRHRERFISGRDSALQLSVFNLAQHDPEHRPRTKARGDQFPARQQRLRLQLLRRNFLLLLSHEVIARERPVAAQAIQPVQAQVLFEIAASA